MRMGSVSDLVLDVLALKETLSLHGTVTIGPNKGGLPKVYKVLLPAQF